MTYRTSSRVDCASSTPGTSLPSSNAFLIAALSTYRTVGDELRWNRVFVHDLNLRWVLLHCESEFVPLDPPDAPIQKLLMQRRSQCFRKLFETPAPISELLFLPTQQVGLAVEPRKAIVHLVALLHADLELLLEGELLLGSELRLLDDAFEEFVEVFESRLVGLGAQSLFSVLPFATPLFFCSSIEDVEQKSISGMKYRNGLPFLPFPILLNWSSRTSSSIAR
jgi:hypothetical protein